MDWSKRKVSRLIELFQQETVLWNETSANHKNSNNRHDALLRIATAMECTVAEVEKKLHILRSQYLRKVTKVEKSKKSGAGASDVYVPKWQFFSLLSFLSKHSECMPHFSSISLEMNLASKEPKNTEEQIPEDKSDDMENETVDASEPPSEPGPPKNATSPRDQMPRPRKRPLQEPQTLLERKFNHAYEVITSTATRKKSEDECFGEYVGESLKQITDRKVKGWVRHSISNILYQAECGMTVGEFLPPFNPRPAPLVNYSHIQPTSPHMSYTNLQPRSNSSSGSNSSPAQSPLPPQQFNTNQPLYPPMLPPRNEEEELNMLAGNFEYSQNLPYAKK